MKATIDSIKFIENGPITICNMQATIKYPDMKHFGDYVYAHCFLDKEFKKRFPRISVGLVNGLTLNVTAKARRMQEDLPSFIGKKLAESRAQAKICKQCQQIIHFLSEKLLRDISKLERENLRYKKIECREIFHQISLENHE